ncbi:hypothetical protein B9Z19DRAFT_1161769 [Tuber borchii]|uniref:dolichyl-phosphate beta-D-mannosyltransferase n=1 Tax=Tuber borchii TaxID=42251 RepID=A0A2T6ZE57_TUBBO|nr:hypothetical protein B9Z19DRAFT_1161769 [Tuber borchii]
MAPHQPTKSSKEKYTFIPPTYNERNNLPIITWFFGKTFTKHKLDWGLIIVDDASPDSTQEVSNQRITPNRADRIVLEPRAGKLSLRTAYVYGLLFAMANFVVIMDSDLAHHDTKYYDIVTGTRYAGNGGVYGWDFKRKLVSDGANLLASVVL